MRMGFYTVFRVSARKDWLARIIVFSHVTAFIGTDRKYTFVFILYNNNAAQCA